MRRAVECADTTARSTSRTGEQRFLARHPKFAETCSAFSSHIAILAYRLLKGARDKGNDDTVPASIARDGLCRGRGRSSSPADLGRLQNTGGRYRGATGGVVFVDNLPTARRNQNRRTEKRALEADRLVRQISTRGSRDRRRVRDDGDRSGCDLACACRKTARYEPGHRADRFTLPTTSNRSGRRSRTIVPDILAMSMTA